MKKLYELADWPGLEICRKFDLKIIGGCHSIRTLRAVKTGEFRCPKAGEWFLSGAIVQAYKAKNNLSTKYHIARIVNTKTEQVISIVQE